MKEKYLTILGLSGNPTLDEIKKAYRRKAKSLHPDVNNSVDSEKNFIQITEAYDYLRYGEEHCISNEVAQSYSQMSFSEFRKTKFFDETTSAFEIVFRHLFFLLSLGFFVIPIISFYHLSYFGLIVSIFLLTGTANFWISGLKSFKNLNLREFFTSTFIVFKTKEFWLFIMALGNIYILFSIGFNTLINTNILAVSYIVLFFIALGVNRLNSIKGSRVLKNTVVGVIPGIFSLVLLLNFLLSKNSVSETYPIKHEKRWYSSRWGMSYKKISLINLPDSKYSEYFGIRAFPDFDNMKNAKEITYDIEEGLLGFRVLKSYKFD